MSPSLNLVGSSHFHLHGRSSWALAWSTPVSQTGIWWSHSLEWLSFSPGPHQSSCSTVCTGCWRRQGEGRGGEGRGGEGRGGEGRGGEGRGGEGRGGEGRGGEGRGEKERRGEGVTIINLHTVLNACPIFELTHWEQVWAGSLQGSVDWLSGNSVMG